MLKFILVFILSLALFLRIYRLPELMQFIGDQAWFYISARDWLISGSFPLVGIASSHPWLHQGAYWTYMLAAIFSVSNFHPLAPAYFSAFLGVVTVFLMYLVSSKMFTKRIGLIAASLYAVSPLIVMHDRMPYHTNPIAPLSLLFVYTVYLWIKGWKYGFPLAIALLALLYNFQISTLPFLGVLLVVISFGIIKKRKYIDMISNAKVFVLSFFAWLFPMIPMLIYDFSNGFPQTVKVVMWIGYKILLLFGYPSIHGDKTFAEVAPFWPFTLMEIQRLVFLPSAEFAVSILILSIGSTTYLLYKQYKQNKFSVAFIILYLSFIIPFVSYFVLRTPSDAYFPMFFATTMLLLAYCIEALLHIKKLKMIGAIVFALIIGFNTMFIFENRAILGFKGNGVTFEERLDKSKEMVTKADGMRYNIVGKGPGSQFESFTMNYEYLTWWLGHGPSDKPEKLQFIIDR